MTTAAVRSRRPALLAGITGLALAGLLMTGCGGSSSSDGVASAGASSEIEIAESTAAESAPAQDGAVTTAAEVPAGWPAEVLVPAGDTVLTTERGGGWDLLIEGNRRGRAQVAHRADDSSRIHHARHYRYGKRGVDR